jgi:hypothetical protein
VASTGRVASCAASRAADLPKWLRSGRWTLSGMATWPATANELIQLQHALGELTPEPWHPPATLQRVGACFVCFERVQGAGAVGDAGSPARPSPSAAA